MDVLTGDREPAKIAPPSTGRRDLLMFAILSLVAWLMFNGIPLLALDLSPYADVIPTEQYFFAAATAFAAFLLGLFLPLRMRAPRSAPSSADSMRRLLALSARYIRLSSVPMTLACVYFAIRTSTVGYGNVDPVPTWLNLLLYVNLSLLPVVLWNRDNLGRKEYAVLLAALIAPRLAVSLSGPRFFVLQAAIPAAVWELSHLKRIRLLPLFLWSIAVLYFLFYLAPSLRHDEGAGLEHMVLGSPVLLVPQIERMGMLEPRPPALIPCEIVAGVTTLDVCNLRSNFEVDSSVRPRLDQAATEHAREQSGLDAIGTGGNPLIEAFPDLSVDWNLAWFVLIGGFCGWVLLGMRRVPVVCFLMPHVTAKSLFLWRATIAEFFERMPFILLTYVILLAIARYTSRQKPGPVTAS